MKLVYSIHLVFWILYYYFFTEMTVIGVEIIVITQTCFIMQYMELINLKYTI